ncbi:hypothetical protein [Cypionkella sp.]|uniref:hypothetical protein n=1 Tax=Cypionkella sp. TaxID=2811411 RepID=UPI002ABA1C84|nr:hypothetical protein [Cypionkella sp.]MDZ4393789.1 hypothetical protein [Cypionkella sp.]
MNAEAKPTPDFNLSARMMFAAMRIAESHECIREYLTGALIEPIEGGGVWIVATDGTGMLVQRDRKGFAPCRAILRVTEPAAKPSIYDEDERPLGWQATRIAIPHLVLEAPQIGLGFWENVAGPTHMMVCESVGDAELYPNWRLVFSSAKPLNKPALPAIDDARFVGWCPRHLQLLSHGREVMRIRQFAPASIGVITFHAEPDAVALLCAKSVDADEDTSLASLLTDIGCPKLRDDLGLTAPTPEAV